MKSKKFNKRLSLNKNTVSNLNEGKMALVKGGDIPPFTQVTQCEVSCLSKCLQTCDVSGCVTVCGSDPCC